MAKTAVIFGVTGQDGSYLAELLLSKDYYVVGVHRRSSSSNTQRIRHLLDNPNFKLVCGDITDPFSIRTILEQWRPQEVYNLAAQSHVGVSFDEPAHTTAVAYGGCLNCLEAIMNTHGTPPRFYQASSSEMFGASKSLCFRIPVDGNKSESVTLVGSPYIWKTQRTDVTVVEQYVQNEQTPMLPASPYAIAKLAAHHLVRVYREAYGLYACSGILFNHESSRRGDNFVTRKITKYVAQVSVGKANTKLSLGNLDAKRDWGHAEDYVRGMYLMLQQERPDDYVLATGETYSVKDFLAEAFKVIGIDDWQNHVTTDPDLFRPNDVPFLRGDAFKAKQKLGWAPTRDFHQLVREMVLSDMEEAKNAANHQ